MRCENVALSAVWRNNDRAPSLSTTYMYEPMEACSSSKGSSLRSHRWVNLRRQLKTGVAIFQACTSEYFDSSSCTNHVYFGSITIISLTTCAKWLHLSHVQLYLRPHVQMAASLNICKRFKNKVQSQHHWTHSYNHFVRKDFVVKNRDWSLVMWLAADVERSCLFFDPEAAFFTRQIGDQRGCGVVPVVGRLYSMTYECSCTCITLRTFYSWRALGYSKAVVVKDGQCRTWVVFLEGSEGVMGTLIRGSQCLTEY